MKLKLITPARNDPRRPRLKGRAFRFPQIALTIIAALTPPEVEVSITDEEVENIDFEEEGDLVGITVMTATAPRAYEIADEFRRRGVKVVLGGMHPSALPHEAIQHADAVVIGEVEGCWHQVIEDFKRNRLQPFYSSPIRPSLEGLPFPRRDLLNKKAYLLINTVQTTRGCPFDCTFCSVTNFFGRSYRTRPVGEVMQEIRSLKSRFIGFLDDNIVGNVRYAKELFKALCNERIKWAGQSSLGIVDDPELLTLAQKSGCMGLFIGFESISTASLKEVGKRFLNVNKYREAIAKLHDHGIAVLGAFIFGMDSDSPDVFEQTLEFTLKSRLDLVQFAILTPFPGTSLFKRLEEENRIITKDWTKYDMGNVVFKPRLMTPEQLKEGASWAWRQFYSYKSILKRISTLGKRFFPLSLPLLIVNASYKKVLDAGRPI